MTGPRRNLPKPIYEFLQNTDSMDRTRVLIRANIINQLQSAENELHKGNPTRARSHYRFMLKQMEKGLEKGLEKNPDHPIRPPAGVERWFAWALLHEWEVVLSWRHEAKTASLQSSSQERRQHQEIPVSDT